MFERTGQLSFRWTLRALLAAELLCLKYKLDFCLNQSWSDALFLTKDPREDQNVPLVVSVDTK